MPKKEYIQQLINEIENKKNPGKNTAIRIATVENVLCFSIG
jgi:hypothetical protein